MKKLIRDFYLSCNNQKELEEFVWDICLLISKIKEKYFRMLNNNMPSWELDYRLKKEA